MEELYLMERYGVDEELLVDELKKKNPCKRCDHLATELAVLTEAGENALATSYARALAHHQENHHAST